MPPDLRLEPVTQENVRAAVKLLTVCYHAGQHGPEDFYRRLGFHPTGRYNQGEAIAERLLPAPCSP